MNKKFKRLIYVAVVAIFLLSAVGLLLSNSFGEEVVKPVDAATFWCQCDPEHGISCDVPHTCNWCCTQIDQTKKDQ